MLNTFQTIALIGKYQNPEVAESVMQVADFLKARGLEVWIEEDTASSICERSGFPLVSYEDISSRCDLAIVLGGDGSLLNAARRLADTDVPLIGVNRGRVGFLTDIGREDAVSRIGEILDGRFIEEQRFMLESEVLRGEECVFRSMSLNDVVLNKGDMGRLIEFDLRIDGEYVYTQRSDGMIVATPTGSTAYALSANGPILHPSIRGIAVVPLCPHALTARPVTLPDSCRIEIRLLPPHDARVHFDGHSRYELGPGDRIRVVRSSNSVRLLHPTDYSYFAMLREKLHWSAVPSMS